MSDTKQTPLWKKILWRGIVLPVLALSILGVGTFTYKYVQYKNYVELVSPDYAPEKFDGPRLYKAAFEYLRDLHIKLDTPEKVAAFTKEWEHKYDATGELKTEAGTDKAILAMTQSLGQRFDYFMDKDATRGERQQVNASLSGIGATLKLSKLVDIIKSFPKDVKEEDAKKAIAISAENYLVIEEPMEGSPAEKAGVKSGDIIRKVDGKELIGMQMDEAVEKIKGKAGTTVVLTMERDGQTVEIPVVRGQVRVPDVKFRDLGNGVSYVKLNDFMSKYAVPEMYEALQRAAKGRGLILDLRGNPGGSLPAVLNMTAMLIEDGAVLVTHSREGDHIVESEFSLNRNFIINVEPSRWGSGTSVSTEARPPLVIPSKMPIIVLVDGGSASASEILSGALQYNHRAIVVGTPTVGKGVGQTVVPLPFGRSMHVTNFEFIPGRTPNDWVGVIPNVIVERGDDPKVDTQLDKAKELITPMIKSGEEMDAKRAERLKKNHEDFEAVLKKRDKR